MEMKNLDGNEEKFDKLILVDKHNIPKPAEDDEDKAALTFLLLVMNCIQIAGGRVLEGANRISKYLTVDFKMITKFELNSFPRDGLSNFLLKQHSLV
jgi:hypothetical protein